MQSGKLFMLARVSQAPLAPSCVSSELPRCGCCPWDADLILRTWKRRARTVCRLRGSVELKEEVAGGVGVGETWLLRPTWRRARFGLCADHQSSLHRRQGHRPTTRVDSG